MQTVTRLRKAGLDAKGDRTPVTSRKEFDAAYAPGGSTDETNHRENTRESPTFYTDQFCDVQTGDVLVTVYPVEGHWRVTGVKKWVNPFTGKEWGMEISVEVTDGTPEVL